jgi:hypothetical protein
MISFFTTPKPFRGHIDVIQRNALKSWKCLFPEVEVIVLGNDEGADQVCQELGLRHVPDVDRNGDGTKSVRSLFYQAQDIARHELLCYCNCDIILTGDFAKALRAVQEWQRQFLMIGRRWDLDVVESLDFALPSWEVQIVERARREGFQRLYYNIDYFAFSRNLFREIPDLVVGRNWWDQWLVWRAGERRVPVVDVSDEVCAVHQNHDYSYHPQGMDGVWYDERTRSNFRNAGGWSQLHTIEDATYRLTPEGVRPTRYYWLAPTRRRIRRVKKTVQTFFRVRIWHRFLNMTRPVRSALGMRKERFKFTTRKKASRRHWLDQ